jgi:hypothetical protein
MFFPFVLLSNPVVKQTRGVSHYGLAIYITKNLKAKEELWKLKYFTMQKYINFQKILLKETKNPSRYYYNSITNLEFQDKPKHHLSGMVI